jgi:hypothetical protein
MRNFNLLAIFALIFPGTFIIVIGITLDTAVVVPKPDQAWRRTPTAMGRRRRVSKPTPCTRGSRCWGLGRHEYKCANDGSAAVSSPQLEG